MLSNIWKLLAIISLVALSLWGLSTWRYASGYAAGKRLADQAWQLKWETRNRDEESARANRERGERVEEHRRWQAMIKVKQNADQQLEQIKADVARSTADAERLRRTLSQLRQQLADRSPCRVSTAGGASPASAAAGFLFADVLGESLQRNAALAAYADRARAAGLACERLYDAVTQSRAQ